MSARLESVASAPLARAAAVAVHAPTRVPSIDILRGLVMVLMALDHVRDFFTSARFDPLDLTQTSTPLFLTRWVTHFCAPTFVLLAGVSAYLMSRRCSRAELSRFLFTRGLWLVVLEVTLMSLVWTFNVRYDHGLFLQVIWAIGVSMMVLAALVRLPLRAIGVFSLVMICGHNLLDGIAPQSLGTWAPLWSVLHVFGPIPHAFVAYPLIPWIGVMSLGYCLGALFELEPQRRVQRFVYLGAASLTAFVSLRMANVYGDPTAWTLQSTPLHTLLSFVNVHKYPPSLQYLLITLGAGFLLLALFESARGKVSEVLRTFGRVPLFFYVLHVALAHLAAGIVGYASGFGVAVLTADFLLVPEQWGFSLPVVYLAWVLVIATLYPACRWFAAVKRRRDDWWLSYL
ncbi:MAG TPA: heparan-alpha-glucosaminide N-acetyltransferase domain-containing protein [Steroidobacteraceae bacterium]|nr:heparan-alpha-glucosaminide N-acetyltransferase domain-containing protein [Steroidobacteraceae bacterium]